MISLQRKEIIVFLLLAFLLPSAFSDFVRSTPQETRTVYSTTYGNLRVGVKAPYQTYPGQKITITVRAEATASIHVVKLEVNIYGLKNERDQVRLTKPPITHLLGIHLDSGVLRKDDYEVMIPSDISPGLTYGEVRIEVEGYAIYIRRFMVTYVRNKAYEDLQMAYSITRNLMYIFIITTIAFMVTTVYFAKKSQRNTCKTS